MYKVKTFGTDTKVFHLHKELERLDEEVNSFLATRPGAELVGASDMPLTDEGGKTIGLVRVVGYRE
jgi:hypothetical protein